MRNGSFDISNHLRISEIGQRVLTGGEIDREEALWLFQLEAHSDTLELLSWANRIREHFKGNKIHLCSIVNIKAGGCSENCRFCSQSAAYQTDSPRYGLVESEPVLRAAEEAVRRWFNAAALVRPASSGGMVILVSNVTLAIPTLSLLTLISLTSIGFGETAVILALTVFALTRPPHATCR